MIVWSRMCHQAQPWKTSPETTNTEKTENCENIGTERSLSPDLFHNSQQQRVENIDTSDKFKSAVATETGLSVPLLSGGLMQHIDLYTPSLREQCSIHTPLMSANVNSAPHKRRCFHHKGDLFKLRDTRILSRSVFISFLQFM